jgi:hypothetical protein
MHARRRQPVEDGRAVVHNMDTPQRAMEQPVNPISEKIDGGQADEYLPPQRQTRQWAKSGHEARRCCSMPDDERCGDEDETYYKPRHHSGDQRREKPVAKVDPDPSPSE